MAHGAHTKRRTQDRSPSPCTAAGKQGAWSGCLRGGLFPQPSQNSLQTPLQVSSPGAGGGGWVLEH